MALGGVRQGPLARRVEAVEVCGHLGRGTDRACSGHASVLAWPAHSFSRENTLTPVGPPTERRGHECGY